MGDEEYAGESGAGAGTENESARGSEAKEQWVRRRWPRLIAGGHRRRKKPAHFGRSISFDKTSLHNYGALIDSVHITNNSNSISYSHSVRLLPNQSDGRASSACSLRTCAFVS